MQLKIYQIDAFADKIFSGNPAAICILSEWLPEALMQAIAGELNLSETAFLVKKGDGYRIRWFSPRKEVKLCGHATLAAAHLLFEEEIVTTGQVKFHSLSGVLGAKLSDEGIEIDLPLSQSNPCPTPELAKQALGADILECYEGDDLIAVLSDASEVEILEPNFSLIEQLPFRGLCVTAPGNGNGYDFVVRFFAPRLGINEDPVTGSAYTALAPLYQARTGKSYFFARQVSRRGGDLHVAILENRAILTGRAKTVMHSQLELG